MNLEQLNPGDIVYAATEIRSDGGIPEIPKDALIATPGTRGVLVPRFTLFCGFSKVRSGHMLGARPQD